MSIRTTVTLEDDVLERVKHESKLRGETFRDTINDLLRAAVLMQSKTFYRSLKIKPLCLGYRPGLNYDDVESLLEAGEGDQHR